MLVSVLVDNEDIVIRVFSAVTLEDTELIIIPNRVRVNVCECVGVLCD